MFTWIASNMANIIIISILVVAVIFAARYVYKEKQKGGCAGCPSNKSKDSSCDSCRSK